MALVTPVVINLVARGALPQGQRALPAQNLPVNAERLSIEFDRSQWTDPASFVEASARVSQDGGLTWAGAGATRQEGGQIVSERTGLPMGITGWTIQLDNPSNPNRRIDAALNVAGNVVIGVAVRLE